MVRMLIGFIYLSLLFIIDFTNIFYVLFLLLFVSVFY